ncbi:MAG: sugar phosphate isomerase/epimerase [Bacteroidota bacterium]
MEIKILSPQWGHKHLQISAFLDKVRAAGYDGIDTWIPANPADKRTLFNYLQQHQLVYVAHQHQAQGNTFSEFKTSYLKNLQACAEAEPLLINSHTGRDYFSFEQNLQLVDVALEFTTKTGITVSHETHRGRLGYSPQMIADFFEQRPDFVITADLSHWVCVTESMLQNFQDTLRIAINRTRYIHARVGFEQGPQVPDPRAAEWQYALNTFLDWWDSIIATNKKAGTKVFPIATEFGPPPYMQLIPAGKSPVDHQFEINLYMKELLKARYQ